MLIALFTILFLGGGTTEVLDFIADAKDSIKVIVVDDERRQDALDIIKVTKKRTTAHNKNLDKLIKQLHKNLREHGGTESDIDAMWDQHFDLTREYDRNMVDLRFQLRDQLTREEWQQIFSG